MAGKADKAALRELMRQHREAKGTAKIKDPLARYSPAGELFCVLCNTPVKSEHVWIAHVQGRAHKQQLLALRSRSSAPSTGAATASSAGRAHVLTAPVSATRSSAANGSSSVASSSSSQSQNKRKFTALVQGYSEDDDEEDDDQMAVVESAGKRVKVEKSSGASASRPVSKLPPGFFDGGVERTEGVEEDDDDDEVADAPSTATVAKVEVDNRTINEKLPDGFFDDKRQDAKARKIEYVDPQVAEYEKFQAEILRANMESEVLVDQDDDDAQDQRQFMELHETLVHAQRVDTLQEVMHRKLLAARARQAVKEEAMEAESDSDGDDNMFDWRAKKISKKV